MNDLDAQRSVPRPQPQEEERVEREKPEAPQPPSGLEWLVKQVKRQRKG